VIKISIVIPTINRYPDLENSIKDLQKQLIQDFEIIIVDQTPKENSKDFSYLDHRVRYFWSSNKSASAARNLGLAKAVAPVVLFIDDDVVIDRPEFLNNHLRHYESGKVPGVVGGVLGLSLIHI